MSSILGVPVDAAYHLVSGFTSFLTPVLGGVAAVAAIILFTVAARLILMPLSLRGLRGQARRPGWRRNCRTCASGTPNSPSACSAR